jgi:hypothetical protein
VTRSTPEEGPPLEKDDEIADLAVKVAERLIERRAVALMDGRESPISAVDIGMAATHRVMNSALMHRLPASLNNAIRVDTPERWQGLECKVMIVLHPLSGVVRPSSFDLETGRLCVMASRHQVALIVVSRDHVGETLKTYVPSAEQPIGQQDITGRGHVQHQEFWGRLETAGRIIST